MTSHQPEDLRPCTNLRNEDHQKSSENDSNRLKKLEKEVYRLRGEVDKIKWQRAAAETAIEHAIVRGSNALGGRYKILIPEQSNRSDHRDRKKYTEMDGASIRSVGSGGSRYTEEKSRHQKPCDVEKNLKGKKGDGNGCGQYTLG